MNYYKKTECEHGGYADAAGVRFSVVWCSCIYSPEKATPEELGYEPYESMEAALEAWGLTAWVDPELEEQFNITDNDEQ